MIFQIIDSFFSFLKNYRKLDDSGESEASEVENDVKLTNDGPLPWCQAGDLVFVAEQVSHHPPISAFYCEHVKKRISVNAHIYTKSSFLGMSVSTKYIPSLNVLTEFLKVDHLN